MKKNQQKKSREKKAPYIGAGIAIGLALGGLAFVWQLSNVTLPSEESLTLALPTAPPVMTPRSSSTPLPASSALPAAAEAAEPEVQAVSAAVTDELQIIRPLAGEISVGFSADRLVFSKTLGDWRIHNGIDFQADSGTEVKAAADGIIERAYQDPQMGYTIIISHSPSYKTVYQNLASTEMVSEGQQVTQGQGIAAVGSSAAAELLDDAHLHFAVLKNETYCDPLEFLPK